METIYIIMYWVTNEDGADLEIYGAYRNKEDCQEQMKKNAAFWYEEVELH